MYVSTVTISSKGQMLLPKKVRDILKSNIISIEVNEDNTVSLSPLRDVGGSLSAYAKETDLSFQEIREKVRRDAFLGRNSREKREK